MRLPVTGAELCNLVPVDWVCRAIVELLGRADWHGRPFHLVARAPIAGRLLHEVAATELRLEGVELAGAGAVEHLSRLEEYVQQGLREYWPYLGGCPAFDCTNTATALPHLPPPPVDRAMLQRLVRFGLARRWGRGGSRPTSAESHCRRYVEQVFPRQARASRLARAVGLDLLVALDVRGPGGGQWSCRWTAGEFTYLRRGLEDRAVVTYRTDPATFDAVVQGQRTPQEAFFEQRIAIAGDLETALKLAVLFGEFLRENASPQPTEAMDARRI